MIPSINISVQVMQMDFHWQWWLFNSDDNPARDLTSLTSFVCFVMIKILLQAEITRCAF